MRPSEEQLAAWASTPIEGEECWGEGSSVTDAELEALNADAEYAADMDARAAEAIAHQEHAHEHAARLLRAEMALLACNMVPSAPESARDACRALIRHCADLSAYGFAAVSEQLTALDDRAIDAVVHACAVLGGHSVTGAERDATLARGYATLVGLRGRRLELVRPTRRGHELKAVGT